MGYLSQKKKLANNRELLTVSLWIELICCTVLLFFRESTVASFISNYAFQLYIYALIVLAFAVINRFYWQSGGLLLGVFILFLIIGQGGDVFFTTEPMGLQELKVMYQSDVASLSESEKKVSKTQTDIAGIIQSLNKNTTWQTPRTDLNLSSRADDKNLIMTPHPIIRSGEVLLSEKNRAGFAELKINTMEQMIFITLDFSKTTRQEQNVALNNLAEFINMQDSPVIVFGDFGQEAWSKNFLEFKDKTGLEVKNKILLKKMKYGYNPFSIPSINLLAYKDFGVKEMAFLSSRENPHQPLIMTLNY